MKVPDIFERDMGFQRHGFFMTMCMFVSVHSVHMYTGNCTNYNLNCTVYTAQYTVYTVQYTVYTVQCTPYNVHCTGLSWGISCSSAVLLWG